MHRQVLSCILLVLILLPTACVAPRRLDRPDATIPLGLPAAPMLPAPVAVDRSPAPLPRFMSRPAAAVTASTAPAVPAGPARAMPPLGESESPDMDLAQRELQKSYTYTGLSDAQIAQQKNGESLLVAGDGHAAFEALHSLNSQLASGVKSYAVKHGDSLWIISGKPEFYGNPWLWPLIWQNNLQVIPDPNRLATGEQLKIRPNPTIQEVVEAVDYARAKSKRSDTRIGEVRELPAKP